MIYYMVNRFLADNKLAHKPFGPADSSAERFYITLKTVVCDPGLIESGDIEKICS